MKSKLVALAVTAVIGAPLVVAHAVTESLVSGQDASRVVAVTDVRTLKDGTTSGTLVNQSPRLVRDVQLLIRHTWFWRNERHPGDDSPGRADYFTVRGEIPAGGNLPFTHQPEVPLPQRTDGHYATALEVVGFTEVGE